MAREYKEAEKEHQRYLNIELPDSLEQSQCYEEGKELEIQDENEIQDRNQMQVMYSDDIDSRYNQY